MQPVNHLIIKRDINPSGNTTMSKDKACVRMIALIFFQFKETDWIIEIGDSTYISDV